MNLLFRIFGLGLLAFLVQETLDRCLPKDMDRFLVIVIATSSGIILGGIHDMVRNIK